MAIVLDLTLAMELKVKHLFVHGNSLLVIQRGRGEFGVKEAHRYRALLLLVPTIQSHPKATKFIQTTVEYFS